MTVIEFTSNQNLTETINLPADGILRGAGSKPIFIASSANPIVKVSSNLSDVTKNAVIENIMLIGYGTSTGILLEDVYNCQIRNVSIKNCDVGIKLTTTADKWSEANHIEHVRMNFVNKGIQFVKGAGTGNFGFTYIADTSISLNGASDKRGIEINTGCQLHNSFVKANVWLHYNSCFGMYVNGEIKYSLINITVERLGDTGTGGVGIYLGVNAVVAASNEDDYNQEIFLGTLNLSDPPVINPQSKPECIVVKENI